MIEQADCLHGSVMQLVSINPCTVENIKEISNADLEMLSEEKQEKICEKTRKEKNNSLHFMGEYARIRNCGIV